MPKLAFQCPKYRRFKARNLAFVLLDGQKIYLGKWKSPASLALYDKLLSTWLQGGRQLSLELLHLAGTAHAQAEPEVQPLTVQQLADKYNAHAEQYYRKAGRVTREAGLIAEALLIACEHFADTPADLFGPARLKQIRQAMIDKKWSRKYINKQVDRIRRAFAWGVESELLDASGKHQALSKVRCLAKDRSEARETAPIECVPDSLVDQTLPHLPLIVADLVRLQRATGMRPSEVCALTPGAVDRTGKVWLYAVAGHKMEHTGADRIVPIGPRGQAVLRKYLERPADQYCFSPREAERQRRAALHAQRKTPASCGNKPGSNRKENPQCTAGDCYTPTSYRRAIARVCKKAGLKSWHPNQLRHSRATEVRAQHGLEAAQVTLGHASAAITQVYAERNLALAINVAQQTG